MNMREAEMLEVKPVEVCVLHSGAVRVNCARLVREGPGVACISVDLHSKYAEVVGCTSSDDEPPDVVLGANERTLHCDSTKKLDDHTIISFPSYRGWKVFAYDEPGRYTLRVVLVSGDEVTEGS